MIILLIYSSRRPALPVHRGDWLLLKIPKVSGLKREALLNQAIPASKKRTKQEVSTDRQEGRNDLACTVKGNGRLVLTHLSLLLVCLFWGISFSAIKVSLSELSPLGLTTLRFALACVLFLGVLQVAERTVSCPRRQELLPLLLLALAGGVNYHMLLYYGEQTVPAGTASLIVASSPIFTAILASLFLRERLGLRGSFGLFLSFAGIVLVSWKGGGLHFEHLLGILAVLGATIGWAAYPILAKPLVQERGALFVSAYTHFLALPLLLPWTDASFYLSLPHLSPSTWSGVLFLAVFCTIIGYFVYNRALGIIGAALTSSYLYLVPIVGLFAGWLFLGEELGLLILFGALLVISGIILTNLQRIGRRGST